MTTRIITLTTDFGTGGGYAGAMKGVIFGIAPQATVVDITHDVPPMDIAHGAFVLGSAAAYYPADAIHVAVVDPGVGTGRQTLLVSTPGGVFLAPDNGLLTYILEPHIEATPDIEELDPFEPFRASVPPGCEVFALSNPDLWRNPVSRTFHGRDIFAPVAAHIVSGAAYSSVGEPLDTITLLNIPPPSINKGRIEGCVIFVDRFGNLVTNIRAQSVEARPMLVEIQGKRISGLSSSYHSDGGIDQPSREAEDLARSSNPGLLTLIGSHGYMEVAIRDGDASRFLRASTGARVLVKLGQSG